MDDIVRQAMARWPNVPHCFGWLALDARGAWRMRDERAQALKLPGDKIAHATLLGFINRNYLHDAQGRWYFQNGPQRVYVNLDATPYIAYSSPEFGFVLHTGAPLVNVEQAWLTSDGKLILQAGEIVAQVDDRDMAGCLGMMRLAGQPAGDEELLEWLEQIPASADTLHIKLPVPYDKQITIQHAEPAGLTGLAQRYGFVQAPQPDEDAAG